MTEAERQLRDALARLERIKAAWQQTVYGFNSQRRPENNLGSAASNRGMRL